MDRVAFVVPNETTWTLPLYELALMTARQAWSMGADRVRFLLVTSEERPLAMFGAAASDAVAELLESASIEFIGSAYTQVEHNRLVVDPGGRSIDVDRVVSLPRLEGMSIPGVPADADGFIPVDAHGRVAGLPGVYAAGDGTAFPIKQGGLATQQADAVAETIAAAAGAPVEPQPFEPVLRGVLLTGGDNRFMRSGVAGGQGEPDVATHALWWPPAKIASRYLAPFLFGRDELETIERIRGDHLARPTPDREPGRRVMTRGLGQPGPIVVGVERSDRSRDALALARTLARDLGTRLILVSVHPGAQRSRAMAQEAEAALDWVARPLGRVLDEARAVALRLRARRPPGGRGRRGRARDRGRPVTPRAGGRGRARKRRRAPAPRGLLPGGGGAARLLAPGRDRDQARRRRLHGGPRGRRGAQRRHRPRGPDRRVAPPAQRRRALDGCRHAAARLGVR